MLGHAGYAVSEAATGDEALAMARADQPDLVITDALMPGMNGWEFVRRLRTQPDTESIPVVFCTVHHVEDAVRHLAATCGVSHFIPERVRPCHGGGHGRGRARLLPGYRRSPRPGGESDSDELRDLNARLVEQVGQLDVANAERRQLLGQLVHAHEAERKRIAEGLHDDSVQAMVAVRMRLETRLREYRSTPNKRSSCKSWKDAAGGGGRPPAEPSVRGCSPWTWSRTG